MTETTVRQKASLWLATVFVLGAALGGVLGYAFAHRGYAAAVALNELSTPDINRAGSFYAGLFGWQDLASARAAVPYKTFKLGERIVAGMMQAQPAPRAAAEWTVYFSVTDAAATVARAESLGAGAVIPLHDVSGAGRLAVLTDPEGAVFAVIEPGGGVS